MFSCSRGRYSTGFVDAPDAGLIRDKYNPGPIFKEPGGWEQKVHVHFFSSENQNTIRKGGKARLFTCVRIARSMLNCGYAFFKNVFNVYPKKINSNHSSNFPTGGRESQLTLRLKKISSKYYRSGNYCH